MERSRPKRRPAFGSNSRVGQRGAATRAKILNAGLQIMDRSGYHGARVEAIAALAGCSRPTFYQYFADKAELFRQLAAQLDDELSTLLQTLEPIDRSIEGRDVLCAWLRELVALHRRNAAVFRVFEATVGSDELLARGGELRLLEIGGIFAHSLKSPRDTRAPLDRYAALVSSTITQACGFIPATLATDRLVAALADWAHRCFFGPIDGVNRGGTVPKARTLRSRARVEDSASAEQEPFSRQGMRSRERLLDAARDVFSRLGYEATRVDDIVAEASVSHGTLYLYFKGKEDVFRALARPAVDDMLALIDELPTPRGGFHSWSRRLYQTYAIHGNLLSLWTESESSRTTLAPELIRDVAEAVAAALDTRTFGDREVDTLLFIAHAGSGPYITRRYPQFTRSDAVAGTAEIFERGFFCNFE